jgi:hypothetical protein
MLASALSRYAEREYGAFDEIELKPNGYAAQS